MKADLYKQNGEKDGEITLLKSVFGLPWNQDLVYQVIVSMQANKRTPVAHAKDRSEVRGGGKKPWKQKGTGRARHGSIRSPIWIGGGATHGPRKEKDYTKKINKKMKSTALLTLLSKKLSDNEILFLDDVRINEPKTKEVEGFLKKIRKIKGFDGIALKGGGTILVSAGKEEKIIRATKNMKRVNTMEARNLNALDVISSKYLILPKSVVKEISLRFAK